MAALLLLVNSSGAGAAFGRAGRERLTLGEENAPEQALPYPGERLLLSLSLGRGRGTPALVRLQSNGAVDRRFFLNARRAIVRSGLSAIADTYVQRDGRVLAVGEGRHGNSALTDMIVIRLLRSGLLDQSFGGNGIRSLNFGSQHQAGTAVAEMSGGKVVVAGTVGVAGRENTTEPAALVRLLADGRIDTSFAVSGTMRLPTEAQVTDLEPSGKGDLLARSSFRGDPTIFRIGDDGTLDPTFGEEGHIQIDLAGGAKNEPLFEPLGEIAVAANGAILVAGTTSFLPPGGHFRYGMAAIRYFANGQRDLGYGNNGTARSSFDVDTSAAGFAAQPSGRVVLVGKTLTDRRDSDFAAVCFGPDGRPDRRFGGKRGLARLGVSGSGGAESVVLQARGRVTIVGLSEVEGRKSGYNQTALARLRIRRGL